MNSKISLRNLLIISLVGFLAACQSTNSTNTCQRDCLVTIADNYLDSLTKQSATSLSLSNNIKITNNGELVEVGEGLWKTVSGIQFKELFADAKSKQAAGLAVLSEGGSDLLLAFRIKIDNNKITEIENLLARQGAHPLFDPEAIVRDDRHYTIPFATNQRPTRQQLISAADAYFDGIESSSPDNVPFHAECYRYENGVRTTNNPERGFTSSCAGGFSYFTYITEIDNRRYPIIDEERGIIFGFVTFQVPGTARYAIRNGERIELPERSRSPRTIYIAELFRLENGKIRDIEAYMKNMPFGDGSGWPD